MPKIERTVPKYLQIVNHYRDAIQAGEYGPGDELPSTRVLASEWGVSKPTALKALEVLKVQDLVTLKPGFGTFVSGRGRSFFTHDKERADRANTTGRIYEEGHYAEINASLTEAPHHVAEALMFRVGALEAIERSRVIMDGDTPLELSTTWYEGALSETCPLLLDNERILEGSTHYVTKQTGRRIAKVQEFISARDATPEEAATFGLDEGGDQALLTKVHLTFDQDGMPLSCTESCSPPSNWRVENSYTV